MGYNKYYVFILFLGIQAYGQRSNSANGRSYFVIPEIIIGKTGEANTGFPETKIQKSFFVSLGSTTTGLDQQWARQLGYPKTGVSIGITDFGNTEKLGYAYSLMPFVEIGIFQKYSKRWNLNVGMGVSYIDTQFDSNTNPFNKAVTTDVNWSFRSFFYYDVLKKKMLNLRMGLGYAHFSNGHTRLPNQGLNSFLVSLSYSIGRGYDHSNGDRIDQSQKRTGSSETYFSFRTGIGQNVLSRVFNDKKEVYSTALSIGKIINRTFKFGVGFYYRFYEHYFDHIKENRLLINEQAPDFRENAYRYATNFGFFASTELLIGHVGIELDLGMNVYKPFYKIDWQLSQGFFVNGEYAKLGELDWYFKVKRTISSRLGLKYYLFNTNKSPKNNIFLGANLNANLGQADFSELSLGYVHRFGLKERRKTYSN